MWTSNYDESTKKLCLTFAPTDSDGTVAKWRYSKTENGAAPYSNTSAYIIGDATDTICLSDTNGTIQGFKAEVIDNEGAIGTVYSETFMRATKESNFSSAVGVTTATTTIVLPSVYALISVTEEYNANVTSKLSGETLTLSGTNGLNKEYSKELYTKQA